jgi:hypothetical protein
MFAIAAASLLVLAACSNKPYAESVDSSKIPGFENAPMAVIYAPGDGIRTPATTTLVVRQGKDNAVQVLSSGSADPLAESAVSGVTPALGMMGAAGILKPAHINNSTNNCGVGGTAVTC